MSEQDVSDASKFENNFDNDFNVDQDRMNDLIAGWDKFNEDLNVDKNPDYKIEGNNVFRVNSFTVDKNFKGKGKGKTFTPKGKGKGRPLATKAKARGSCTRASTQIQGHTDPQHEMAQWIE